MIGLVQNCLLIFYIHLVWSEGDKKNRDIVRLRQDLEERARIADRNNTKNCEEKGETMYVDNTRNVGVLLGEKDLGKHIKRKQFEVRGSSLLQTIIHELILVLLIFMVVHEGH